MESKPEWCPICLEEFDISSPETDKHNSRCGHPVHRHCLHTSMRSGNYTCSICRSPYGDVKGEADQPHLKRYVKMLQQKLSFAVVRQRMETDRIAPDVIDAFFTGGASVLVEDEAEVKRRAENVEPVDTLKFLKMLKIGMGEGAVRQKMESAGFSHEAIDLFFSEVIESQQS